MAVVVAVEAHVAGTEGEEEHDWDWRPASAQVETVSAGDISRKSILVRTTAFFPHLFSFQ